MQENAKERDNFNTYLNFFISVKEFKKSNKIGLSATNSSL